MKKPGISTKSFSAHLKKFSAGAYHFSGLVYLNWTTLGVGGMEVFQGLEGILCNYYVQSTGAYFGKGKFY
jgi:hypothetical protein